MSSLQQDVDAFYELLSELESRCGGKRRLAAATRRSGWPQRGVYFFFEAGEFRADGTSPRVVRVGTHGLRPSHSTLWGRLAQHRGSTGGSTPGGGNHRGSIFRLHVGTALLASGDWPDSLRQSWGAGSAAPQEVRLAEYALERAVSAHIGEMQFLWLEVDDAPSAASARGVLEANSIALLSNFERPPIDPPSPGWLGLHADRAIIKQAGLWNINHVRAHHDPSYLSLLASFVRGTGQRREAR